MGIIIDINQVFFFFNVEMRGKKVNVKTGSRNSQGITSKIL